MDRIDFVWAQINDNRIRLHSVANIMVGLIGNPEAQAEQLRLQDALLKDMDRLHTDLKTAYREAGYRGDGIDS